MDSKKNRLRNARDKRDRKLAQADSAKPETQFASALEDLKQSNYASCIRRCQDILRVDQKFPAAYLLMARAWFAQEKVDEAIHTLQSAIKVDCSDANICCELGNLLSEKDDHEGAQKAWQSAIAKDNNCSIALKNLGSLYFKQGQLDQAAECLQAVLVGQPEDDGALRIIATICNRQGKRNEAIELLKQAVKHAPNVSENYRLLSSIYRSNGQLDEFVQTLDQWLRYEPDNAVAAHLKSAYTGDAVSKGQPKRASDGYVRSVFDQFAATFDSELEQLNYQAPALVEHTMTELFPGDPGAFHFRTLDAGCGTGLCGPMLRRYSTDLVGVDLSPEMLKSADGRRCYDKLVAQELTSYLLQVHNHFDLIVGCDTFNYFGDLTELLNACRSALKVGGHLMMTLEKSSANETSDYVLNLNGRYVHTQSYVDNIVEHVGLVCIETKSVVLRNEADKAVHGTLVVCQRDC